MNDENNINFVCVERMLIVALIVILYVILNVSLSTLKKFSKIEIDFRSISR